MCITHGLLIFCNIQIYTFMQNGNTHTLTAHRYLTPQTLHKIDAPVGVGKWIIKSLWDCLWIFSKKIAKNDFFQLCFETNLFAQFSSRIKLAPTRWKLEVNHPYIVVPK